VRFHPFILTLIALVVLVVLAGCTSTNTGLATNPQYRFQQDGINSDRALDVVYYRPDSYRADSDVLFVIHGNSRNPKPYCESWLAVAENTGALIICPDFARENGFPTADEFNMGNVFVLNKADRIVSLRPENDWSFSLIEALFDDVKVRFQNNSEDYLMFGHSAGAQFVHRHLLFKPDARVRAAVAANAGWYTLPANEIPFPYGLGGSDVSETSLMKFLGKKLTILLGAKDVDPNSRNLRQTPEARKQGNNRFERGRFFYEYNQRLAKELGVQFNWNIGTVSGVGHDQTGMAPAAANILFER